MGLANLAKVSKKETPKTDKNTKKATGKLAEAIDQTIELRNEVKRIQGELAVHEATIKEKGCETMVKQMIEEHHRKTISFETSTASMMFMMTDKYVTLNENSSKDFKANVDQVIPKFSKEILEEEDQFSVNPKALENKKVLAKLEKLAIEISEELDISLLTHKKAIKVKKGTLDRLAGMDKLESEKLEMLIDLIKPVIQLK